MTNGLPAVGARLAVRDSRRLRLLNFATLASAFEFYRGAVEEGWDFLWIDLPGGTRLSKVMLERFAEYDDGAAAACLRLLSNADAAAMECDDPGVPTRSASRESPSEAPPALVAVSGMEVAEHSVGLAQVFYASAVSCNWNTFCWSQLHDASDAIIVKTVMLSLSAWMLAKLLRQRRSK